MVMLLVIASGPEVKVDRPANPGAKSMTTGGPPLALMIACRSEPMPESSRFVTVKRGRHRRRGPPQRKAGNHRDRDRDAPHPPLRTHDATP